MVKKTEVDTKKSEKKVPAKKVAVKKKPAEVVNIAPAPVKKAKAAATPSVEANKAAASTEKKRAAPASFLKELTPSKALAAVVGAKALTRAQVTKAVWDYIKKHKLQDAANKRVIKANAALKEVFGKAEVNMLEIAGLLSKHLTPKAPK